MNFFSKNWRHPYMASALTALMLTATASHAETKSIEGQKIDIQESETTNEGVSEMTKPTELTANQAAVKQAIDDLIQTATSFDVETLERVYHDDLKVIMYDISGELNMADKAAFKSLFQSKRDAGDPPMDTWAEFHLIEATENTGHVLLSRKNNLAGHDQILILSIDLIHEDGRWQVTREVIFLRPEES